MSKSTIFNILLKCPIPAREKAIALKDIAVMEKSKGYARQVQFNPSAIWLYNAFDWKKTNHGYSFWKDINLHVLNYLNG